MCSQVQRQITILPLMFFVQIQKPFLLVCGFISLFTISAKISYNSSFIVRFVKYLNKLFLFSHPQQFYLFFFCNNSRKIKTMSFTAYKMYSWRHTDWFTWHKRTQNKHSFLCWIVLIARWQKGRGLIRTTPQQRKKMIEVATNLHVHR